MKEDFLHFICKHQKFLSAQFKTTQVLGVQVLNSDNANSYSGPDFFHDRINFDALEWAGNVEVHTKSSVWFYEIKNPCQFNTRFTKFDSAENKLL